MIAGKRKICYTDVSDFTNIQGVGNDPIYKRFSSVFAVIKQHIDEPYQQFFAEPEYCDEEDRIYWYTKEWAEDTTPIKITELDGDLLSKYKKQLNDILSHYKTVISSLTADRKKILESAIKYVDENFIYCIDGNLVLAVWGMQPDEYRHNPSGIVVHELDLAEYHYLYFDAGKHGVLSNRLETKVKRKSGSKLTSKDIPQIIVNDGFEFVGWEPVPLGLYVTKDLSFVAMYHKIDVPKRICKIQFLPDENCTLQGYEFIQLEQGATIPITQIPSVILKEGYSFIGWDNDINAIINDDMAFHAITKKEEKRMCHVNFTSNSNCKLSGCLEFDIPYGELIVRELIPNVQCSSGYNFIKWSEDIKAPVTSDLTIYAVCEKQEMDEISVSFNAGDHGVITGNADFKLSKGTKFEKSRIPIVKPKSGYEFVGWDKILSDIVLNENIVVNAIYEEKITWWKRIWVWLTSLNGCLLKLLRFLILLLLFLFLLSLLRKCDCDRDVLNSGDVENGPALVEIGDSISHKLRENPGYADEGQIGNTPSTPIDNPDLGEGIDPGNGDNEYHVGIFPPNPTLPPIDNPDNPQGPQIIPNVINVFFTDDNANLNAFAKDFRNIWPDTQRYLLDYDDLVKRVSIMMPVEERIILKKEIERRLSEKYSFFIVDEFAIQQSSFTISSVGGVNYASDAGWHLIAVNAPKAWKITLGNPDITVAVVDDGFDISHDFIKNKIVYPYNVFTKSQDLSNGSGHGTHTAGLAVGLVREDGKAAGIAPGCKLMPIQVFNENQSTISAEVSGIAYAIHNGADVVNISMGCSYAGFRGIPADEQIAIAKQKGKVEELLWQRVFKMAKEKNTILVFSAGNDNVVSYLNPQNRPDSIISVTAVDQRLQKSIFSNDGAGSNYGLGSTVSAPGSSIYSSVPVNDYAMMQGTSMAAPIVTGIVALLKSVKRDITIGETIDILKKSGKQLADVSLGPLVQADRAIVLLKTGNLPSDEGNEYKEDNDNHTRDYSAIFKQIAEHQRAIADLIKQLPPEEQEKYR